MNNFLAVALIAVALTGCVKKPEVVEEIDMKKITDIEILQARKFIVDFDQRVERANTQYKSCAATFSSSDTSAITVCFINAHRQVGITTESNVVAQSESDMYRSKKEIATIPLSTEQ